MFLDFFTQPSGSIKVGMFWVYFAVSCCTGICTSTVKFTVTNETNSYTDYLD